MDVAAPLSPLTLCKLPWGSGTSHPTFTPITVQLSPSGLGARSSSAPRPAAAPRCPSSAMVVQEAAAANKKWELSQQFWFCLSRKSARRRVGPASFFPPCLFGQQGCQARRGGSAPNENPSEHPSHGSACAPRGTQQPGHHPVPRREQGSGAGDIWGGLWGCPRHHLPPLFAGQGAGAGPTGPGSPSGCLLLSELQAGGRLQVPS